ncbi:hypothetical protein BGZ65_010475 [Modicella reniformis]|uniref:F-box domain-containing protein n=1 Tax=Modicella reniformis TaxID=1440133 RepID=A0A9P6M3B3_9FUNG|nr:hypothetical protein BGZ65_010475 [Modicella reniformis]
MFSRSSFPPLGPSRYPPLHSATPREPENYQRRLRPRKTRDSASKVASDNNKPEVHQEAVFAIPELLDLITTYLTKDDLRVLICVNRAWSAFWVPYLYSDLFFRKYKRTRTFPKMKKYGHHVKTLEVHQTKWINVVHLIDFATRLHSLSICNAPLTDPQLRGLPEIAPQLRILHLSFVRRLYRFMNHCPLRAVAALSNLEDLEWNAFGAVRVDDILHVLQGCNKLRTLTLSGVHIVEELQEPNAAEESEVNNNILVRVADDGWENTTLRTLHCISVLLGARQSFHDEARYVHPCLRRLFQHLPNLKTIKFTAIYNLSPLDWHYVFENRVGIEHVELFILAQYKNLRLYATEALGTLARFCSNLKVLDARDIYVTTDQAFEQVMRVNHQLQKVSVKNTDFGDLALEALARSTTLLSASSTMANCLVELDLEGCIHITNHSVAMILENCGLLRDLNLLGTRAGTIELFQSSKPWPCSRTLEKLHLDIQPVEFKPFHPTFEWEAPTVQILDTINLYTTEEYQLMKERLTSLTSLVGLQLGGEAMTFGLLDNMSFAPRLRRVILRIPFSSSERFQSFSMAQKAATERGNLIFPNWIISASARFVNSRLSCTIIANINSEPFQF